MTVPEKIKDYVSKLGIQATDEQSEKLSVLVAEIVEDHGITEFKRGFDEAKGAYGNCRNCYGKGYATMINQNDLDKPLMRFCEHCDRGPQLKKLMDAHVTATSNTQSF